VQLKGKKGMPTTFEYVEQLRGQLTDEFPGVEFAFDTGGMMTAALNFGLPSPINIKVQGSNLETMDTISREIQRLVSDVPGAVDVRIAQRMDYPQIGIDVDRVKAAQLGLTQEDVIKNVVTSVNSSIGFDPAFWIAPNGNHYFIGAQYAEETINSMETLRNIPMTGGSTEQPVPLRTVADFYRSTGPAVINHVNITRTLDVYANVRPGYDVGGVAMEMEQRLIDSPSLKLDPKQTPRGLVYDVGGDYGGKGYSLKMSGEVESMRSAFKQFTGGLGIALILVYLVMVAQLRSFSIPFVILLTIPLGFIGIGITLFLTGTNLSIPVFMGVIMMTGIVVEYSIILLSFADQRVREGIPVRQAITEATWIRLRPIMMTSLTTWLALIPMAIGAAGGEANAPLARTIIGGVLAATALSLIAVPCLYVLFKRENNELVISTNSMGVTS
jgi:multidrug efflux pump subunit AcrB